MKTHISLKGFTLVELVVTITILAILGTIAFISLGGYTLTARNAVRLDSISKISSEISKKSAVGQNLLSFVQTGKENPAMQLQGTGTTSQNYRAGVPNYSAINLKQDELLDPLSDQAYLLGISGKKAGVFQVAASIEGDIQNYAKVVGKLNPRGTISIPGVGNTGSRRFEITDSVDIGHFYVNDFIAGTGVVVGTFIESISENGRVITLSQELVSSITFLQLLTQESEGLIISIDGTNVVTDDGEFLPYQL